jgi:hypothetical protein
MRRGRPSWPADMLTFLATTGCAVIQVPERAVGAEPRERAFGIAKRADRSPWAGATVRLVSEPFAGCADVDVVETTTDAKGEFRAAILTGRAYTAWASARDGDEWIVSRRIDDVVPKVPVVLEAVARESRVAVRLRGLDAWQLTAPLTLWCAGAADGCAALPVPPAGAIELPPTGTGERWLFVSGAGALDLLRHRVDANARGELDLALPPPHDVDVRVLDETGKPIAGAGFDVRARGSTTLAVRTGADGRATLRLPAADAATTSDGVPAVWAHAPGCLPSRLTAAGTAPVDPAPTDRAQRSWRFHLFAAATSRATLEWEAGVPIANAAVVLGGFEAGMEPSRRGDARRVPRLATEGHHRTTAAGTIDVPFDARTDLSIGVLLSGDGLASLRASFGPELSPLALLRTRSGNEPLVARVSDLHPVRLVVRRHEAEPLARARVRVGAGRAPVLGLDHATGGDGAVTLLLPPGEVYVAMRHGDAAELLLLTVPEAHGPEAVPEVLADLVPPLRVRGTVVDAGGAPVADATVVTAPLQPHERRGTIDRIVLGEWLPPELIVVRPQRCPPMAASLFACTARTNAAGEFELQLPALGLPLELRATAGARTGTTSWGGAEADGVGRPRLVVR